jgi:hypothetical protein
VEIRDNLLARILEAERDSWVGEIEVPTFREVLARTATVATPLAPL